MIINGGWDMCIMSDVVTRELNIEVKSNDWIMITANTNRCNSFKGAVTVPVNVPGMVIPLPIVSVIS
jgi:hypothetical protein